MGTAGHIDHGKTALIKALSGIDCDTHPEEKLRGITINLGFAHLHLPSGNTLSIVDVPGHKDFIHTMVSGASGIDFVCMVIAADSGIMPQTREHLQIMQMLQITTGVVALTKTDLVDNDIIELAQEEIRDFVRGTFLERAKIVPVSALTRQGIPGLADAIEECVDAVPQRQAGEIFRMFVDRIFTVSGFGTVVTGSVISGAVQTGGHAYLLPSGKKLRLRRIQRHGEDVQSVVAGDRASLNLVGLEREDFRRGMIIADRPLNATRMVDVRLSMFRHARKISLWSDVIFLLGTFEAQARIHVLDKNSASGGDTVLAQIHLPQPCNISIGDRFIVRSTSGDLTLGGGEVIDATPLHHRRRRQELIENLEKIAEGDLPELIAAEVRKHRRPLNSSEISERLNVALPDIAAVLKTDMPPGMMVVELHGQTAFIVSEDDHTRLIDTIIKNVESYHKRNPVEQAGRTAKELLSAIEMDNTAAGEEFLVKLLEKLVLQKRLKQVGNTWALASHTVTISQDLGKQIDMMDTFLAGFGMKVPLLAEIEAFASKAGMDSKALSQVLRHLINKKRIYHIENDYLHAGVVDSMRIKLMKILRDTPGGLTVAQFRDLVADNRKICLRLFSIFDIEGLTLRKGDIRYITEKGRTMIADQVIKQE